jgi:hypothetical protein
MGEQGAKSEPTAPSLVCTLRRTCQYRSNDGDMQNRPAATPRQAAIINDVPLPPGRVAGYAQV